ncbi:MAG: ABC transporter substrate-binding protein [Acidimicrobiia bacterium]|jgi:osmoprotectant transport system substrate-binding protein
MRQIARSRVVGAALAVALVAAACGSGGDTGDIEGPTVTVASFNFNESTILAEIYAQVLENDGYPVARRLNLGNREVVKPALESGEISLVPEYVGTLLGFLGGSPSADPEATWQAAKDLWEPEGVTLLAFAPGEDKNAYVVTRATAEALGLSRVSDLQPVAGELVFGGPPECPDRDLCLKGLEEVYGLQFAEFKPLDVGGPLTVAALKGGDIDVALLFSSQGIILVEDFVVLDDDQDLNPAENIVPAVAREVVDAYGDEFVSLLDSVSALITTEVLIELNRRADIDQVDPAVVAKDWLVGQGLIGG